MRTFNHLKALLCVLLILVSSMTSRTVRAQSTASPGAAVLQRMHDAYAGKWYRTLRFVQKTTQIPANGQMIISTWYESLRFTPEHGVELRIDFGDPNGGNGVLYTADSSWRFRGGKLAAATADGNEFLPVIEGVYLQPVERTMADLASAHIDFSRVEHGTWEGKAVTIIGASGLADTTSPQVWIEDERNVAVRMVVSISPSMPVLDIRLSDYVRVGQGWLATKVALLQGGQPRQLEEYADWKADIPLSPGLFSRSSWSAAGHWALR